MNILELIKHPLFTGLDEKSLPEALKLFESSEKSLKKGECIFNSGSITEVMGFVLEGRIQIESTDYWGNKTIIDNLGSGKVFGETYALTGNPLMVDVVAVEDSRIMLLKPKKLFYRMTIKSIQFCFKIFCRLA